ncbi:MAG: hypothetical protein AB1714_18845 [Acidobacteriota bacterium]
MSDKPRRPKCRVFLVGEGKQDIGDLSEVPQYRRGLEGFLQPILRRLCGGVFDLEFEGAKIAQLPRTRVRSPARGLGRKAAQALALASELDCRALVFVADADRSASKGATRHMKSCLKQIENGFNQVNKGTRQVEPLTTIVAMACPMIEAWALGDQGAVAAIASPSAPALEYRGSPESFWGAERDPDSNHPKRVLDRAIGRTHTSADLAEIAEHAEIEAIENSCPHSFAPFAHAVRRETQICAATARASHRSNG